jgi:hypothetical protein
MKDSNAADDNNPTKEIKLTTTPFEFLGLNVFDLPTDFIGLMILFVTNSFVFIP